MKYSEAEKYLLESLPMYQRIGQQAYKGNLSNAYRLDAYFGHQHKLFKTIHIGGTNGKGSVSHMLSSVLQQAGYKTGLFTSPHMHDFRERIKVNGRMISRDFVSEFVEQNREIFSEINPSFFEISVFLAFSYFAREKVDIAVIEVGLGGRLDTTNIITPAISVITNIGLDHTQILGNTLQSIAAEKAGIIKEDIPVVIGESQPELKTIFQDAAEKKNCLIRWADEFFHIDYQMANINGSVSSHFGKQYHWTFQNLKHDLKGIYQKKNIPTVLMTLSMLAEKKQIILDEKQVKEGFGNVIPATGLMGRWQEVGYNPLVVCDTAHNSEGFTEILKQIESTPHDSLYFILGFVQEKDIAPIVRILPKDAFYFLTEAVIPRAMKAEILAAYFEELSLKFQLVKRVGLAFEQVARMASAQDMIYIGGSTFIVAEFLKIKNEQNSF
jgi:dihydrofolate synthase / folylpolyglutamate synthase